ncbi:MAG: RHS domain-containing protein, partial [Deltaproteobacteria bacterium]|nr:RHS domain-containing protein [Deltaproteobacteria bacterium]
HLGTPQKLTATNGAVVWSATYESFGKAIVNVETVENNLRFPGQYYDEETGLHYNYHRYYDPGVGRYLRVDPISYNGKTKKMLYLPIISVPKSCRYPNQLHIYTYVGNNAIKLIDPQGLKEIDIPPEIFKNIPEYILQKIEEMTVGNVMGAACAANRCKYYPKERYLLGDDARRECLNVFEKYMPGYPIHFAILQNCAEKCQKIINTGGCEKKCAN